MVYAEGDCECRGLFGVALQLSLFDAAAAPPDLTHRQEAAGRLVNVHDRSAPTACLSISQHSLMNSRCVLACCCSGLWSSFTHLAGFLMLRRMPRKSCFTQVKRLKKIFQKKKAIQTVTSLFFLETNLSHGGPHCSRSKVISASQ